METLLAITVAVGVLKAQPAQPVETRPVIAAERNELKAGKADQRPHKPPPSIGF